MEDKNQWCYTLYFANEEHFRVFYEFLQERTDLLKKLYEDYGNVHMHSWEDYLHERHINTRISVYNEVTPDGN